MAKVWIFILPSHSLRISLPALRERDSNGQKKKKRGKCGIREVEAKNSMKKGTL
jgi:hypothetical protein